jgi:hypothetical protein
MHHRFAPSITGTQSEKVRGLQSRSRFHRLYRRSLTSIKKIGPALPLSVTAKPSPILSSWFDGGRSADPNSASSCSSRHFPPVSREQVQHLLARYQTRCRWSLSPDSRRMVASSSSSVSMLWSPPSACVAKVRASTHTIGISLSIAGPWPVVVAAEGQVLSRYQALDRPIRCQVPLYHSVSVRCLLAVVAPF